MNNLSTTLKEGKIKKLKTTKVYVVPYLVWSFIFLVIPVFILIFMAFSTYDFSTGSATEFTLKNWSYIFGAKSKEVFWPSIGKSLLISTLVTILCLLIGYPTAFVMTRIKARYRALIMALLILPLWMNQVLRIVSWRTIFEILSS